MRSNATLLLLSFNILFFFLVISNPAQCQSPNPIPDPVSIVNPLPMISGLVSTFDNPLPIPNPAAVSTSSNLMQISNPILTPDSFSIPDPISSTSDPLEISSPILAIDLSPNPEGVLTSDDPLPIPDPVTDSEPTSSTPAAAPPVPSPSCSLNPRTVTMCGASLIGGPATLLLSTSRPCCAVLRALDRSEASVCLCPIFKPVTNQINLDMANTLNMLLRLCQFQLPINIECA